MVEAIFPPPPKKRVVDRTTSRDGRQRENLFFLPFSLFFFKKRREAKVKKPITNIKKSGWLTGLYNRLGNCCPSTSPVTWRWPADVRSQNMPPMPWFTRATFFFLHHFFVSFYCWAIDSSSSHTLLPSHLSEWRHFVDETTHTKIEERGDINVHHRHQYAKYKSRKAVNQPNRNQFSDNYVHPPRNIKTNKQQ